MRTLARSAVLGAVWLWMVAGSAAAQTFSGAMSGSWWDAARPGEGQFITFETAGARNVAYLAYFTYSADGRATWHVGNVDFTPGAATIAVPLVTGSGARFGAGFSTADVRTAPAGTATLEFVSCTRMRLRHTGNPGAVLELTRLVGALAGAGCTDPAPPPTGTFTGNVSGSWWNAARGGEGQFITFESVGGRNVAYVAYFTYTADGAATWLVGNADFAAGATRVVVPLVTGSGARFGAAFLPGDVRVASAGTATIEFQSCATMRLSYAGAQSFTLDLTRLVGPLSGIACTDVAAGGSFLDVQLRPLLGPAGQTGNARAGRTIPAIDQPLPQLGKLLFFSKTLSGNLDAACASCHHPALGGADGLSLSVGTGAAAPNVMGPGRALASGGFSTSRNSNTFFNSALWDSGLFFDSRVESLGKVAGANGAGSAIRTPDSPFGSGDPAAGPNLPAAQARFPVVSVSEMKGTSAYGAMSDANVRSHIAARLGNYGTGSATLQPSQWLARFRAAFNSPNGTAEALITFDNVTLAIAEYERSATFTDSPWARYVRGDNAAIPDNAKLGALRFFRGIAEGGAHCVRCHKGDAFTDERHTVVGFPQVGPGMGDGATGTEDFGRERASGLAGDRYRVRTPSLLNVELTAPYGHAGNYADLNLVSRHYILPDDTVNTFVQSLQWCSLPSFLGTDCAATRNTVNANSIAALERMRFLQSTAPNDAMPQVDTTQFSPTISAQIVAFLRTLTDPCLVDRACFGRWIPRPDEAPDAHQLNATDASGNPR
jgi:cytochrome c peroxidase